MFAVILTEYSIIINYSTYVFPCACLRHKFPLAYDLCSDVVVDVTYHWSWIRVPLLSFVIYVVHTDIVCVHGRYTPRLIVQYCTDCDALYSIDVSSNIENSMHEGWNPWQDSRVHSDIQQQAQLRELRVLVGCNFTSRRIERTHWPLHVLILVIKKKNKCKSIVIYIPFVFK